MKPVNCEHINEKLSGYIDMELTQQDTQAVSLHLETCENCQNLYDELIQLKTRTGQIRLPKVEEEEIMQILNEPTSGTLQMLGWISLTIGLCGLVIWHWFEFWQDSSIPVLVKIMLSLFEAGGLLLFLGVLRQRLISRKSDPYKDIQL